jgi:hypothetical protein
LKLNAFMSGTDANSLKNSTTMIKVSKKFDHS